MSSGKKTNLKGPIEEHFSTTSLFIQRAVGDWHMVPKKVKTRSLKELQKFLDYTLKYIVLYFGMSWRDSSWTLLIVVGPFQLSIFNGSVL